MPIAHARAIALQGLGGDVIDVESHLANGLPAFLLIGLPDTALGEARDRVRAALQSTGCALPLERVTVNLSPASLRKHGSGFDLAIAVAVLAADGRIDAAGPSRTVHVGELGLDGTVRGVPGVLPVVTAAARAGVARVMVPAECAAEAGLVDGVEVVAVASLRDAALHYGAERASLAPPASAPPLTPAVAPAAAAAPPGDLADIIGNDEAVRALTVAAAGGHHLFLLGPPGAGKTMLAERLVGLLPDLDVDRAVEAAALRSLCGLPLSTPLDRRPPLQSPHHTASQVALLGGGSGVIRPGAASLASGGVLFLDEAPEFRRDVLDALRQSLESGRHVVHRGAGIAEFPARYQLVLAANPCPCGNASERDRACACTPQARVRYLARLSGPLLDRIDLQLRVERVSSAHRRAAQLARETGAGAGAGAGARAGAGAGGAPTTAETRAHVVRARAAGAERLAGTPWRTNAEVPGTWLRHRDRRPAPADTAALDRALDRGLLTMRGYDRVLRVAWSIADLDGAGRPSHDHVREAMYFRTQMGAAA